MSLPSPAATAAVRARAFMAATFHSGSPSGGGRNHTTWWLASDRSYGNLFGMTHTPSSAYNHLSSSMAKSTIFGSCPFAFSAATWSLYALSISGDRLACLPACSSAYDVGLWLTAALANTVLWLLQLWSGAVLCSFPLNDSRRATAARILRTRQAARACCSCSLRVPAASVSLLWAQSRTSLTTRHARASSCCSCCMPAAADAFEAVTAECSAALAATTATALASHCTCCRRALLAAATEVAQTRIAASASWAAALAALMAANAAVHSAILAPPRFVCSTSTLLLVRRGAATLTGGTPSRRSSAHFLQLAASSSACTLSMRNMWQSLRFDAAGSAHCDADVDGAQVAALVEASRLSAASFAVSRFVLSVVDGTTRVTRRRSCRRRLFRAAPRSSRRRLLCASPALGSCAVPFCSVTPAASRNGCVWGLPFPNTMGS